MKTLFLPLFGNPGHAGGFDEHFGKVDAPVTESVMGLKGVSLRTAPQSSQSRRGDGVPSSALVLGWRQTM